MSAWDYASLDERPVVAFPKSLRVAAGLLALSVTALVSRSSSFLFSEQTSPSSSKRLPFTPTEELSAVTARPGPPGVWSLLPLGSDSNGETCVCLFVYGPRDEKGKKEALEGASQEQSGWLYGARLYPSDRLAVPTGSPDHILKGKVMCWEEGKAAVSFTTLLQGTDALYGYNVGEEKQMTQRGLAKIVLMNGDSTTAMLYYQMSSPNALRPEASPKEKKKQSQPQAKKKKEKPVIPLPECPHEYWDTHCHLDMIMEKLQKKDKNEPSWSTLRKDRLLGCLGGVVSVSCDTDSYQPLLDLLDNDQSDLVYGAFGMHPHEAKHWSAKVEEQLVKAMKHPKVVAWGECGLDYFYNYSSPEQQQHAFVRQIQLAVKTNKPLMVHTREAEADTLRILKEHAPREMKMHVHCFTSSTSLAKELLQTFPNLYLGFTGVITFGSSDLQDTVRATPLNRMLTETDGPFMSPAPYRGDIAHPGHIPVIAQKLADLKCVSLEQALAQIRLNIKEVYGV